MVMVMVMVMVRLLSWRQCNERLQGQFRHDFLATRRPNNA
jgi:hypothetical protein